MTDTELRETFEAIKANGDPAKCAEAMRGLLLAASPPPTVSKYHDYLRSPAWKILRRLTIDRDGGRCRVCNSAEGLEVHHRTYERIYNEQLNDLTTLCADCHDLFTAHNKAARP